MTKQEIHEALCAAPDDAKMRLCIACQANGTTVENVEQLLANILTGVQEAIKPALRDFEYLRGGMNEKKEYNSGM